jgi:hypothetical protein
VPRDREKALTRQRRYRERKKVEKYGPESVGKNMSGRHGNHARGSQNGRWNSAARMISSEGYVLVRVGADHPLAFGNGYAYEHLLVWRAAGNAAPGPGEVLHHKNEDKADNRIANLELTTRSAHAVHHSRERGRDELGRFPAKEPGGDPTEWPEDLRIMPGGKTVGEMVAPELERAYATGKPTPLMLGWAGKGE